MPKYQLPGPKSAEYIAISQQYEPGCTSQQAPIVWESAQGCIVRDVDGHEFIDWTSGVLVANVGHCHPQVVQAIDEAALNWGVKVLRYEIKDLTPPKEILHAMQQQITAEREKRALIAASEGRRQEQINIATGEREAFIARSEGEKQAVINKAQGEAESIKAVAEATAQAIERVAAAIRQPGGEQAVQLKVAEKAVDAYSQVASDATTTLIVPSNMTEVSALVASAMKMIQTSQR